MSQATWAIWAAIKQYNLRWLLRNCQFAEGVGVGIGGGGGGEGGGEREREKERKKETNRQTARQTGRQTDRDREISLYVITHVAPVPALAPGTCFFSLSVCIAPVWGLEGVCSK